MATNLGEVVSRMELEVSSAKAAANRLGFFASLYRRTTVEVRRRIEEGLFDNAETMTALTVDFSNRYFDALDTFRGGSSPSLCWQVSFDAAADAEPLILHHLLLGMNAHINFDLAISTAKIAAEADGLAALKSDFDAINTVLVASIDDVETRIGEVSPRFHSLDELAGSADERALGFSIPRARDQAWRCAEMLVRLGAVGDLLLPLQDTLVAGFGEAIIAPAALAAVAWIREAESDDVAQVIEVLDA